MWGLNLLAGLRLLGVGVGPRISTFACNFAAGLEQQDGHLVHMNWELINYLMDV